MRAADSLALQNMRKNSILPPEWLFLAPSSSGPGHVVLSHKTGVRFPVGPITEVEHKVMEVEGVTVRKKSAHFTGGFCGPHLFYETTPLHQLLAS